MISGGDRRLFNEAFPAFQNLLLSFWGSDGTVDGIVAGNIHDNTRRELQLDGDPQLDSTEVRLNERVLRVQRDRDADLRLQLHGGVYGADDRCPAH